MRTAASCPLPSRPLPAVLTRTGEYQGVPRTRSYLLIPTGNPRNVCVITCGHDEASTLPKVAHGCVLTSLVGTGPF